MFAGQVMLGGGVWTIVMVKLQEPPPVAEVTFTTVVPSGKNEPEAGLGVIAPQLPAITSVEVKVTNLPGLPPCVVSAVNVKFSRQVMVQVCAGGGLGTTADPSEELSEVSRSVVALVTEALFSITAPAPEPAFTWRARVNLANEPGGRLGSEQVTTPPLGGSQLKPNPEVSTI